jgi:hypothetical protein
MADVAERPEERRRYAVRNRIVLVMRRQPSNQAMERTADRSALTFQMTSTLSLRATRAFVRRRSSCSR